MDNKILILNELLNETNKEIDNIEILFKSLKTEQIKLLKKRNTANVIMYHALTKVLDENTIKIRDTREYIKKLKKKRRNLKYKIKLISN